MKASEYISEQESLLATPSIPIESYITAETFLSDVDARYPNGFTEAQKIVWLNEGVRVLYGYMGVQDYAVISTVADQYIYSLPSGVEFDAIKSVTMSYNAEVALTKASQAEYLPVFGDESLQPRSYFQPVEGKIGFYPCPEEAGMKVRIRYQKKGQDVATRLSNVEVRKDYLPALKFHVLRTIALSVSDISAANNFGQEYNSEMIRLRQNQYAKDGKYPTIRNVDKKPRGSERRRYISGRQIVDLTGRVI